MSPFGVWMWGGLRGCPCCRCQPALAYLASQVIISAPAKDAETPTIVVGVNTDDYKTSMSVRARQGLHWVCR